MSERPPTDEVEEDDVEREADELRTLLEIFLTRSRELEKRESRALQKIERIHSAVTTLKAWNDGRRGSAGSEDGSDADAPAPAAQTTDPVLLRSALPDVGDIDEESRLIREETERIRKEVQQKKEENKRLEEKVASMRAESEEEPDVSPKREEGVAGGWPVEGSVGTWGAEEKDRSPDPALEFFDEKLRKLRELKRKMKRESVQKLEEGRRKEKHLMEKIRKLERDARISKEIVKGFSKQLGNKRKMASALEF